MFSNFNDTGSRSSREVSPADSSSITSIIIQITSSQPHPPTAVTNGTTVEPSTALPADQAFSTTAEEPESSIGDDNLSTPSPIPPNSPEADTYNQRVEEGNEALATSQMEVSDSEWAFPVAAEFDQPLTAPPMVRSGPTIRRPYAIRTKWNTPLSPFREFIESLPDGGTGVVLIAESLPWQKYITLLSAAEAEEVRNHEIVATVEPHFDFVLDDEKTY